VVFLDIQQNLNMIEIMNMLNSQVLGDRNCLTYASGIHKNVISETRVYSDFHC